MPSPAELDDGIALDVGELIPDEPDPSGAPPGPSQPADQAPADTAGSLPAPDEDEPPAHARRDWHRTAKAAKPRPGRITAAVRSDIEAKIGFGLTIPGAMWAARDPVCGGQFMAQLPEVARVGAAWVCRSSALVDWFTSPAGSGFILFLDTAAALGPVFSVVMAHHVYHTVGDEPPADALQPDYGQYAA